MDEDTDNEDNDEDEDEYGPFLSSVDYMIFF
jgi:hypothetical protein